MVWYRDGSVEVRARHIHGRELTLEMMVRSTTTCKAQL